MECPLLQKSVFEFYTHNNNLIWNIDNVIEILDENCQVENILNKHKEYIDNIDKNIWNYNKKLVNDFEALHIPSKNMLENNGVADYIPISRAFFKMLEILNDFPSILDISGNVLYGALCEGPGGFIEAFNFYRRNMHVKDNIVAITLRNDLDDTVPSWKKSDDILKQCNRIYITYGFDSTGNLYNIKNIEYYVDMFGDNKADLITGDGGFDFSENYNNQEITIVRLLWCEVVTGILSLKKGGSMIIKLFDIYRQVTKDIIYILCHYFNKVYISKPYTSRPLNSEKYVVCIDFKNNIRDDDIDNMKKIIDKMSSVNYKRILKNEIDNDFNKCVDGMNTAFAFRQVRYMNKVFNIINKNVMYKEITLLHKERIIYAIAWCIKYNFPMKKKYNLLKGKHF
jgi:23S rRNA U2552 (ribose-2'-O)-methylase RlmE/FtsJ